MAGGGIASGAASSLCVTLAGLERGVTKGIIRLWGFFTAKVFFACSRRLFSNVECSYPALSFTPNRQVTAETAVSACVYVECTSKSPPPRSSASQ